MIRAVAAYDGTVGDPRRFGPIAVRVVEEARRRGEPAALVVGLRAVAWYERSRLEHGRATQLLDEAVRVATRAGLAQRLVDVLVTRAAVALERGDVTAATRDLDRAGTSTETGPPDVDFMRAVLLHNLGRLDAAEAAYRRVLAHPDSSTDNRGSAANNAALIAVVQGRFEESLEHLDAAAAIGEEVGPSLLAFVAHNRGLVLAQSGRLAESLRQFDLATKLFQDEGIPLGEHYIEHADVLADLRLVPEARDLARRAAAELAGHGVLLMAAEAELAVAHACLLAGDPAGAMQAAENALSRFRRQRRTAWAARAVVALAEGALLAGLSSAALLARVRRAAAVLDRLGMPAAAVSAHMVAGRVAEELGRTRIAAQAFEAVRDRATGGSALVRLKGTLAAARAENLGGREAAVLRHCRSGLAELGRYRSAFGSMELRALASGHGVELGRLGLATLLRTGSGARVLGWMERTRAAALLTVEPAAPETARAELADLAVVRAELAQVVRETGQQPVDLLARQSAAEVRVRRATWQRTGSGADDGDVVPAARLHTLLGRSALVSYGCDEGRLFAVVLRRQRSRLVDLGPLDPVRFEADALLFALRRLTRPVSGPSTAAARASAEHSIRRLREILVRPLGVPADQPLVVVPEAGTNRVPWSALHDAPVCVAPSASLWARTTVAATPGDPGDVVLVAGPGLPGAGPEVTSVAGLYERPRVLGPGEATVGAVVEALAHAGLAHLACHGVLRADNPTFSALELADGPLTVHELDVRGIAPPRVVLAACDSAADVSYDGDELLGFVSALLARGTVGLVASVVAVGDVEAVELMQGLHRGLVAGHTMAQALHAARGRVDLTDPRAFVNWCAFSAYGAG